MAFLRKFLMMADLSPVPDGDGFSDLGDPLAGPVLPDGDLVGAFVAGEGIEPAGLVKRREEPLAGGEDDRVRLSGGVMMIDGAVETDARSAGKGLFQSVRERHRIEIVFELRQEGGLAVRPVYDQRIDRSIGAMDRRVSGGECETMQPVTGTECQDEGVGGRVIYRQGLRAV